MTELFCNFLRFKAFRDAFLSLFLERDVMNCVSFSNCSTQIPLPKDRGTPDLAISDDSNFNILIEVKTGNTPLTHNQPESYLEYLKDEQQNSKWMVFIVPKDYRYLTELESKIDAFLSQHSKAGINTKILFWQHVIQIIKERELPILSSYFSELYKFLKGWYQLKTINFNNAEVGRMFDKSIPEIMIKLNEIVDGVKTSLGKTGVKVTTSSYSEEYGIYIWNKDGKKILWFGIWYPFWKEHEKPLCYGVDTEAKDWSSHAVEKFKESHPQNYIEYSQYHLSWINKDILPEDDCLELIAKTIENVLIQLLES